MGAHSFEPLHHSCLGQLQPQPSTKAGIRGPLAQQPGLLIISERQELRHEHGGDAPSADTAGSLSLHARPTKRPVLPERCRGVQRSRRGFLARLRNLLLAHALRQEDHVLWVDADILHIPRPLLPALLTSGGQCPSPLWV